MITKERFKELYNQDANVYFKNISGGVGSLPARTAYLSMEALETDKFYFETYEEAEWYIKYGNITRVETLSLPTWEKIQKRLEADTSFNVCSFDEILMFISDMRIIIHNYGYKKFVKVYDKKLTKENYIKACEICKKLFLGEEE